MWMRTLCACFVIFLLMSLLTLAEDLRWAKAIHVEQSALIHSVEQTLDGGFAAAGQNFVNDTTRSVLFVRLDSSGKLQWAKDYGVHAHAYSTLQTADGGFVFVGNAEQNALVVKLDVAGNILWQNTYGAPAFRQEARSIVQTADGGFLVVGHSNQVGSSRTDVWCMKLSSEGRILWQKRYGNAESYDDVSNAIGTNDGGLIFVGYTDWKPWVVKLNKNGDIVWQKAYSLKKNRLEWASAITATADGNYVVGGASLFTGAFGRPPNYVGWVTKLDSMGKPSWGRVFPDSSVSAVRQEKDGHVLVTGTRRSSDEKFIWTARLDSEGKMFWIQGLADANADASYQVGAIHDTSTDGTILVGSMSAARWDGLIVKTGSDGLTCGAFRKPVEVTSEEIPLTIQSVHLEKNKNHFVMQETHLRQVAASVKIENLCATQ